MFRGDNRIALACILCRTRHVRCDGETPACTRCQKDNKVCSYTKSRRGGRCRTAADQTRPRLADPPLCQATQAASTNPSTTLDYTSLLNFESSTPIDVLMPDDPQPHSVTSANTDQLLELYYAFFHDAHPCVLPLKALRHVSDQDPDSMELVISVMTFIGSLYAPSIPSKPLERQLQSALRRPPEHPTGFYVQALLLYSIAVYWSNEIERSLRLLDQAICLALDMGMHYREFALANGQGIPVLEECWRRTWWQLYINDMHVASSHHVLSWRTSCIATTAELPCEEHEYEAMVQNIPEPRSLQDYENREFLSPQYGAAEASFSSFAHVVGLTRSLDLALAGIPRSEEISSRRLCKDLDAAITGWYSHLPKTKRILVKDDGSLDELLFKAQILLHTCVADVHRPLSALAYSSIEAASRCAPPAPPEHLSPARASESQMHTSKVLHAIEAQTELLTLPTNLLRSTPFLICMIANTTIAHLSACRYVLKGRSLALARERIRASMGALKVFEDVWELGKRTRREVGIVAREILALDDSDTNKGPTSPLDVSTCDTTNTTRFSSGSEFCNFFEEDGRLEDATAIFL